MPILATFTDRFSPFLFEFSPGFGIRYYGLAYVLGFLFLLFFLRRQAAWGWCRIAPAQADDLVLWLAIGGVIVGGRLGYCLFYDFGATVRRPWTVFEVWQGGMASHGGILGVIVVMLLFARKWKVPFYNLADAAALCTPVGLGLGRIANFINGELWGRPAQVPWAVLFPNAPDRGTIPRHPSQLYEAAMEGVVLFLILLLVRRSTLDPKSRFRDGAVALTFMAAYGILRIVGECFREPDAWIGYYFGGVTQGQLFSAGMVAAAAVLAAIQFRGPSRA